MSFEMQHMSLWLHTACKTSSCMRVRSARAGVWRLSSTGCRSSGAAALLQIYRLTNVLNKKNTCQRLCMSVLWWLMCVKYGITAESDDDFQCCLLQPCGGSDWSILSQRKPWRPDSIPLCLSSVLSLLRASVHHFFCVSFSSSSFFPLQPFPLSVSYHIFTLKFLSLSYYSAFTCCSHSSLVPLQ